MDYRNLGTRICDIFPDGYAVQSGHRKLLCQTRTQWLSTQEDQEAKVIFSYNSELKVTLRYKSDYFTLVTLVFVVASRCHSWVGLLFPSLA